MSVQAAGSQGAYSYLQSLLQQQSGITNGQAPLQTLLDAFYPTGDSPGAADATAASTSTTAPVSSSSSTPTFSPDTLGALISLQGSDPVAAKAQSIFAGLDANGDGSISQSEFESAFGSGADTTKVDALFNALDANGDGSVSQNELTSAAETSHAQHHHHHAHGGGGGGGGNGGGLNALLSSLSGANSQTTNNSDGSTSTTITYADGSSVVFNSAAASAASGGSSGGGTGQQTAQFNMLEKLIQMQSQLISAPDSLSNSTLLSI